MSLPYLNANAENQKMVKERYSVAFPVDGSAASFELKVWHKSPEYMSLVVRRDLTRVLPHFRVGGTVRMDYYAVDLESPSEKLETEVVNIKKNGRGRLKGQYLVDLQILKSYH
jgi:hypothetical protein